MKEIGTNAGLGLSIPIPNQLPIIKEAGFTSFFTGWNKENTPSIANAAAKTGIKYQTIHAPFAKMNCIWENGLDGDDYAKKYMDCVSDCADNGVGIMITHVTVATVAPPPSDIGAYRFGKIIELAEKKGVTIALENLEIPEHLAFLFERFGDAPNLGFCYDCGHNLCYTPKIDMIALYGDRLVCTHVHDNLGMKDPCVVTWHDDLHYLPFDGVLDFNKFGDDMKKYGKGIPVTLELNINRRPDYAQFGEEGFIFEAAKRARRIAALCE